MSWSIRVNMAVLAPIPNASESIAIEANRGLRPIARSENRTYDNRLVILTNTDERSEGDEKSAPGRIIPIAKEQPELLRLNSNLSPESDYGQNVEAR